MAKQIQNSEIEEFEHQRENLKDFKAEFESERKQKEIFEELLATMTSKVKDLENTKTKIFAELFAQKKQNDEVRVELQHQKQMNKKMAFKHQTKQIKAGMSSVKD